MEKLFEEFCKDQEERYKLAKDEIRKAMVTDVDYMFAMARVGLVIRQWSMTDMTKLQYGIQERTFENAYFWKKAGKPKLGKVS